MRRASIYTIPGMCLVFLMLLCSKQVIAQQKTSAVDGSIFGFFESNTAEQNGEALDRLSQFVSKKKNLRVSIPKGVYKVVRETGNQAFFTDCSNVTIDGNGAEFIFQDTKTKMSGAFFRIEKSENFQLKNLVIDWNWDTAPLSVIGKIKAINDKGILYELMHGGIKTLPKVHMGREWDDETMSRSLKGFALTGSYIQKATMTDGQHLFLDMQYPQRLKQQDIGKFTHIRFNTNYFAGAIYVENSKSVVLSNITIHTAPETAISCYATRNFKVENCSIMPKPNSNRFYAAHSAGELHNLFGDIVYQNNKVIYSYDDGLHISSGFTPPYLEREDVSKPKEITAKYLQHYFLKDVIRIGDIMEFHDANFKPTGFKAKLIKAKWMMNANKTSAPNNCILTFDKEIPDALIKDHYIFNTQLNEVKFKILNNTFKYNGCHGIHAGLPNGTIEGNNFYRTGYPPILMTLVLRWGRWVIGPNPGNSLIRNNVMDECNTASRQPAAIFVGAGIDPQNGTFTPIKDYRAVQNVRIIGNTVKNTDMPALGLWAVKNAEVRDNIFENVGRKLTANTLGKGAVFIGEATDIKLFNNTLRQPASLKDTGLNIDKTTTQNVKVKDWVQTELPVPGITQLLKKDVQPSFYAYSKTAATALFYVYQKLSDDGIYTRFTIIHQKSAAKNDDLWRVIEGNLVKYTGSEMIPYQQILAKGENEFVWRSARPDVGDFTGGYHGDERIDVHPSSKVTFYADGQPLKLNANIPLTPCTSFYYHQFSTMHQTGTGGPDGSSKNYVPIPGNPIDCFHEKRTVFESNGYSTYNKLTWNASVPVDKCYFGIICINKDISAEGTNEEGTQVTFNQDGKNKLSSSRQKITMVNKVGNLRITCDAKIIKAPFKPVIQTFIWDNQNYHKYYSSLKSTSTKPGNVWETVAFLRYN